MPFAHNLLLIAPDCSTVKANQFYTTSAKSVATTAQAGMPLLPRVPVVGSAPSAPLPPKSVEAGRPDYPSESTGKGIAGKKGAQGTESPASGNPEESVFGPRFIAYLLASIVVKCTPDCFK